MPSINFQRTYQLKEAYESIKENANQALGKYLKYPDLITFKDLDRSITFSTERLIPTSPINRPQVMLLFSNPHPYSVLQGMFLSQNTKGQENLFWPVMESAGWLPIPKEDRNPKQLAEICLNASYQGSFEFIFYCYYAFPTNFPEDIIKIFGKEYFRQVIEPKAKVEFRKTIQKESVEAVVTFNKGIFNLVSKDQIECYIERLKEGELIQSQIKDIGIPIFLTFPTGWRFDTQYKKLRKDNLDTIKTAICSRSNINAPASKNT